MFFINTILKGIEGVGLAVIFSFEKILLVIPKIYKSLKREALVLFKTFKKKKTKKKSRKRKSSKKSRGISKKKINWIK